MNAPEPSGPARASLPPAPPARPRWLAPLVAGVIAAAVSFVLAHRSPARPPRAFAPDVWTSPMAIALYAWIALSLYWEIVARGASKAHSAESPASRAVHLVALSAAQLLMIWPFPGWPFVTTPLVAFPRVLPAWPWLAPAGLALTYGGLLFAVWARRSLGRNWSGAVTLKVDHALVRTGPYRRIRHPIYTGLIAMYLGIALVSGRLQGELALVLVLLAYARKIRQEERALREQFGADWDAYRGESWALVPWVI